MLVQEFLTASAETYQKKPAVCVQDRWLSYEDVEYRSNQMAHYLQNAGISQGDCVAILLKNSFEYVISYFGILKAGAVAVPLNTDTTSESVTYCLNHAEATAIITTQKLSCFLTPSIMELPTLKHIVVDRIDSSVQEKFSDMGVGMFDGIHRLYPSTLPSASRIDQDLAMIVYTSGSTGKPKGVMLSHLNLVSNTNSIVEYLKITRNDRVMVVLPFYYIYGKSLLTTHIAAGGSLVIDNRFAFPQVILEAMREKQVTGFAGVPSTYSIMLSQSNIKETKLEALRYVTQAGGHMATALQKEVIQAFAPAKLYVMYGATEAAPRLAYLAPDRLEDKLGSIGKAVPNVELRIVDQEGHFLSSHEEGEIVARGSNIMMGYWRDEECTENVLCNGWYHTGDLGQTDEDGYIYVVGRKRDIIKVSGNRVSAKEIEDVLMNIEGIHEVAVIGVPDDILGEAIKAYVVVNKKYELTCEAIQKQGNQMLPSYKRPKHIELCETLPKNKAGKVMKTTLKAAMKAPQVCNKAR